MDKMDNTELSDEAHLGLEGEWCDRCSHSHENLFHLLYECPCIQNSWWRVINWWNEKRSENVALNAMVILYGNYKASLNQIFFQALNHYVIIAKFISFVVKKPLPALKFSAFS